MSEELKPISGRMLIELADLWENESIDIAHPERRACLREHVDTLRMLARSPRIDTTLQPDRSPTHRCTICGAFWMEWSSNWSLCSKECGPCCDNQAMGEQIAPLVISDLYQRVDRATDAENQRLRDEVEALRGILEMADDAYWGMIQTELAASAVGVDLARQITSEGYGLNLKLAMKAVRSALTRKAPQ